MKLLNLFQENTRQHFDGLFCIEYYLIVDILEKSVIFTKLLSEQ